MPQTGAAWAGVISVAGMAVAFYDPRTAVGLFVFAGLIWFIGRSEDK